MVSLIVLRYLFTFEWAKQNTLTKKTSMLYLQITTVHKYTLERQKKRTKKKVAIELQIYFLDAQHKQFNIFVFDFCNRNKIIDKQHRLMKKINTHAHTERDLISN